MTNYQHIEFELDNKIGTIWMNRPEKHNAMNAEMIGEIIDCFESVSELDDVRVVVLRGKG